MKHDIYLKIKITEYLRSLSGLKARINRVSELPIKCKVFWDVIGYDKGDHLSFYYRPEYHQNTPLKTSKRMNVWHGS